MTAVLVTIGSLGHLSLYRDRSGADRARRRGAARIARRPSLDVHAAGLAAQAILPSFVDLCARLGIDEERAARRIITPRPGMLDAVIPPSLPDSSARPDSLAADADIVVGLSFALAAGIIAEKHGLPLVAINPQPMALFSAWDPPRAPDCAALIPTHRGSRRCSPLHRAAFHGHAAETMSAPLLADAEIAARATAVATKVRSERSADTAAERIIALAAHSKR